MFIDARLIEKGSLLKTSVCIIGGGIAGITLGLEFIKQGIDCCLLESGGYVPEPATQDLYKSENEGLAYLPADTSRSRFLGGSSNCWGGWCAPMEKIDFEKRDWVSNSGWPIELNELTEYYRRSHDLLKLGPFNYEPGYWEGVIAGNRMKRIPVAHSPVRDMISQFSPPARLGTLYREELRAAKKLTVYLHANVTELVADEPAQSVEQVKVSTLHGTSFHIAASQFILATGGIENARLLLASNAVEQNGLGNEHDLVGRYFMEHPRLLTGKIRFSRQWPDNRLYDIKYNYHNALLAANGTCIAGQLAVTPDVQRSEGLLNARVSFSSVFPGEGSDGAMTLWRCKEAIRRKDFRSIRPGKDLLSLLRNPLAVTGYGLTRIYRPKMLVRGINFQIISEQAPNALSRVKLIQERDCLGMPKTTIDWRLGMLESTTINRTLEIIAKQLGEINITEKVALDNPITPDNWPSNLEGAWHHMGTTRMHHSPKQGVVDANCKIHGKENVFVAGSSVFPTGGANFPTITLTALAIRLADHIGGKIGRGKLRSEVTEEFRGLTV